MKIDKNQKQDESPVARWGERVGESGAQGGGAAALAGGPAPTSRLTLGNLGATQGCEAAGWKGGKEKKKTG